MAQAAGADIDQHFTADRTGDIDVLDLERLTNTVEYCCFHADSPVNRVSQARRRGRDPGHKFKYSVK